jgi:hypothetical protein
MFPARFAGEACRWRALAAFRRPLSDGEATTRYRATGGAWELDRLPLLLPDASGRGGWRGEARRCSSVEDVRVEPLQEQIKEGGQGGAPIRGEEDRGEERGSGSLSLPISSGDACRCVGLRRGISPAWRRFVQEDEREMEGESRATYRRGHRAELLRQ